MNKVNSFFDGDMRGCRQRAVTNALRSVDVVGD